ncbi:5-(carboxyamino)imidazole ribonucleotide synthase [Mitsuaria sp. BK045]|jgi:5-(carboxyamino)imidazole ribonucleotide synthase|uniref:5-(carboxyamino)imidazole ribonucleotide synthase n=1 Tax=unclassified Roseateles TaxID=2626991 RepID=UPI00160F8269|nr:MULTISPECIES: 5-(carboxyamino)imidazole ribonucleotide synthase [unclassified Roseateles]MBB3295333.1 5-(carboxyamino)imidazole ribonucleotide synthase [Mitsuaria sp. BK041]MBB3364549.1 5-(carboxyamino)imidazole ribonucleotide synthase [Mitsuaria sp. BK045]
MPLLPGAATLGVLGGGQLGRMFVHAAQALGYRCVVLDPDAASPAGAVAQDHLKADYLDAAALEELARRCDAITTEFENVPARALEQLARTRVVAPGAAAVAICQDRAREKAHFDASGVACAPYAVLRAPADLAAVPDALLPGILKTARLGYDGKGQRRVADRAQLAAAFDELGRVDCVLEQMLPLALELSVLVVRGAGGEVVTYPVQQNLHRDGILAVTEVPAPDVDAALQAQARRSAAAIATGMGYVGVLCVEFFVLKDGRLVVNEMAPRPHNSGHYTMNACDLSQFEMQVRAMAGLPLREPRLHSPVVMLNLLGDLWFDAAGRERAPDWAGVLALPGAELHLYGKAQARPGRKMGHLNVIGATAEEAREHARRACALLGLPDTW